jgi:hypothetical protein
MAILEFGTWEGSIPVAEKAIAPRAITRGGEGDRRLPILPAFAVAGETLGAAVLHAKHVGERYGEPSFGDRLRHSEIVWWIGEGDVVRPCLQAFHEA